MASEELALRPEPAADPTTAVIPVGLPPTVDLGPAAPATAATGTEIVLSTMRREFDPLRLISEQVMEGGEVRGRPDLRGFWLRDRNGQLYEFTDYDAYHVTHREDRPTGKWRPRARSTLRGGPYVGRAEQKQTVLTPGTGRRWTVKVTPPDGEVADIIGYEDDALAGWLDHPTDECTPFEWFTDFGWQDAPERPRRNNPDVRPIERVDPDKSVFDTVMEHQERLGLGLKGVTWKVNGSVQRVTEDVLLMEGPDGNKHPVRTFVVKTYNAAGDATHQRVYKDGSLKKHLNTMGNALSDLHLEMPEEQPEPAVLSSLGRVGTSFMLAPAAGREGWTAGPDTVGREHDSTENLLHREQAIALLAYEDIFTFDDIYRDHQSVADRVRLHGEQFLEKYVEVLQEMVAELGKTAVIDMASRMTYEYTEALKDVGLRQEVEDASLGTMLWQLAEQRYLNKHPRELTDEFQRYDDFGAKIGNPFDRDTVEARRVQTMIVNDLLGRRTADMVLVLTKPAEKSLGHDKDGKNIVQDVPATYSFDWDAFNSLNVPDFVRKEVVNILQTVTAGKPGRELSKRDFVAIGRNLQRARSTGP